MPTYHHDIVQGSDEWLELRCGRLTASEMKLVLTPTLKVADNEKTRTHVYELAAQRVTGYVEPHYVSDDMLRGHDDEVEARLIYAREYAEVEEVGFITNDQWGFTIGYSPDGLVGSDGLIEIKSRRQKFQLQTITDLAVPDEYVLQLQTGLLVTGRKWIDFVSYSGGMEMVTLRVLPDPEVQEAILKAATSFETKVAEKVDLYKTRAANPTLRLVKTERRVEQEMYLGEPE